MHNFVLLSTLDLFFFVFLCVCACLWTDNRNNDNSLSQTTKVRTLCMMSTYIVTNRKTRAGTGSNNDRRFSQPIVFPKAQDDAPQISQVLLCSCHVMFDVPVSLLF